MDRRERGDRGLMEYRFLPAYGYVARGHAAAVLNGTVAEVNEELVRVE